MTTLGPQTQRSPGPDVARGVALAIVAMSNTMWWVYADRSDPSLLWETADKWTGAFSKVFVIGRAYPMFSFLFGYGIVQMLSNLAARGVGPRQAELIVIRRNLFLIALGFLHALLLFSGDVLGSYGVLGLLCLAVARLQPTTIALIAFVFLFFRIVYDFEGWSADLAPFYEPASASTYLDAMELRVKDWLASWPSLPFYLAPMLIGVVAARKRLLEEPARHLRLLLVLIVAGFAISILSGLPEALVELERWYPEDDDTWIRINVLGGVGGVIGGIALAALASLLAHAGARHGMLHALLEPVRALGRRSLSGYLFQSLVFLLIFPSYTLGYGSRAGQTVSYLIALGVWAVSLVLAVLLERGGLLGPGEWLTRRATYGRRRS